MVYDDVAKCKKAHADIQNKTIKGERLVVVYAKRHSQVHPPKSAAAPAAKRPLAEAGKKGACQCNVGFSLVRTRFVVHGYTNFEPF